MGFFRPCSGKKSSWGSPFGASVGIPLLNMPRGDSTLHIQVFGGLTRKEVDAEMPPQAHLCRIFHRSLCRSPSALMYAARPAMAATKFSKLSSADG